MRRWLPLIVVGLIVIAVVASRDSDGGGTGANGDDAPARAQRPVTVSGSGIENSDPFRLEAGDYRVSWTATPHGDGGCYHGASLDSTDESQFVFETLASEMLEDASPVSGTTNIYGLEGGEYYVGASSGCDWEFTFSPQ